MRVRPLALAAAGVAAVGIDLRIVGWDVLPDMVGWLLIAGAGWRLAVGWTGVLAAVAAVASVVDVNLSHRYDAIDPISGEVVPHTAPSTAYHELLAFNTVSGARLLLISVGVACGGASLWLLLRELSRRAAADADDAAAHRLGLLAWAVALGWAAPQLARIVGQGILGDGDYDPIWNAGWELPGMLGIAAMIAAAVSFATTANREWSGSDDQVSSPWAELRRHHHVEG